MTNPGFDLNKLSQNREIRRSEERCAKVCDATQEPALGTLSQCHPLLKTT